MILLRSIAAWLNRTRLKVIDERLAEIEDQIDSAFQSRDWMTVEWLQDEQAELLREQESRQLSASASPETE